MKLIPLAAALALAACATAPAPLYHYLRSNQDGSLPEHIYVYRPDATRVEVGKIVRACANAAYVTADLDPARGQPSALTGGRIAEDGSQEAFAWLSYDPATRGLHARVPSANVDQSVTIEGQPWMLYDFDLSDLNALFAGRAAPREDFRYAVALIWLEDGATELIRDLGFMNARYAAAESHNGRDTVRFDVSGALTGQLWLDAAQGFVVEAAFDQPNHAEYENFRLVLQSVQPDGAQAWAATRAAHWANCP